MGKMIAYPSANRPRPATNSNRHAGAAPACFAVLTSFFFTSPLPAQSAASFESPAAPPAAAQPAQPEPAPAAAPSAAPSAAAAPAITTPSRLIGHEVESYVAAVSSTFAMRDREVDPFGQYQDPDARPVAKPTPTRTLTRAAPEPSVPLSEIVRMIKVTTVVAGERLFLVGTRTIKQGDRLPLNFRGKPIVVEVGEVSSRQILFRNAENGEIGILKLDLLPEGMTPGNRELTPPGMAPLNANAPLILGAN